MKQMYFIVSYTHSDNGVLTFWRANNAGYTTNFLKAGRYTKEEIESHSTYYNNGHFKGKKFIPDNVAMPCEEFEQEAIKIVQVEKSDNQVKYWQDAKNNAIEKNKQEKQFLADRKKQLAK